MFKDLCQISYDNKEKQWQYQIIDDDFKYIGISSSSGIVGVGFANAIMDCYVARNLPIVPNLIRAMLWFRNEHTVSLDEFCINNKEHNPRWHEVEQDIKKYLIFS